MSWTRVDSDELLALHRVAQQAREAVEIAAAAGVYLGPLRAALDQTPYAPDAAAVAALGGGQGEGER